MKRLEKASNIAGVVVIWCDDEGIHLYIPSDSHPEKKYRVDYYGSYWRCDCTDYDVNFKKPYGSFTCKHILAAIRYIMANESWKVKLQEEVFA